MKVLEDIMRPSKLFCKQEDSLEEVALQMIRLDIDFLPVLDNEAHVIGTVTHLSISKAIARMKSLNCEIKVEEIMNPNVTFLNSYDDEATALMTMRNNNLSHLHVVDSENRLKGIVSFVSIARRIISFKKQLG